MTRVPAGVLVTFAAQLVFTVAGCSAPSSTPIAASPDLGDPCANATSENETCGLKLDFSVGPVIGGKRDHHGSAIATHGDRSFLYVTGGTNYSRVFDDVQYAEIAKDGSLGVWMKGPALPIAVAGHGIAVVKGRLYIISGQTSDSFLTTVVSAEIGDDGALSPWRVEENVPEGRFHAYVALAGDFLYLSGGLKMNGFTATATNYVTTIREDGVLSPWRDAGAFAEPRSHHSAWVYKNSLYAIGGLSGSPMSFPMTHTTVVRATIASDGSLSAFATVGMLADSPMTHSIFSIGDYLYLAGGLNDAGEYLSRIERAKLDDTGLGAFELAGYLPFGRSHVHQTPTLAGHLYTIGGSKDYHVVTDEVSIGKLDFVARDTIAATSAPLRVVTPSSPKRPHCLRMTN